MPCRVQGKPKRIACQCPSVCAASVVILLPPSSLPRAMRPFLRARVVPHVLNRNPARPDQAGFFSPWSKEMSTTPTTCAHVCTPPQTYRVKVAGIEYTGQYVSACMAVIAAMVMYGTHSASAKRVPE